MWKNVVAFETYAGNELVEVCIVGTGTIDNSSTFIRYPKGLLVLKLSLGMVKELWFVVQDKFICKEKYEYIKVYMSSRIVSFR